MAEQKKNQTAEEYFGIVTTGRQGVEDMLAKMGGEIQAVGADNLKESGAFETWKMRALVEVSTNQALIDGGVLGTRPGLHSVYQALAKSANMGLQFGGHFPQAYLVPKAGKAVLIVSEEGLAFIGTYGPGAVLSVKPELHEVFEKDRFSIDDAARTYQHEYAPFAERGKLVGYFTVLEYKDGRKQIPYILQAKVRQIEKAYGGTSNPAYSNAPEQMDRKTAMKAMLRPVAKESEGLAMAYSLEEGEPEPVMRDVTDRTVSRLAQATEALGPEHAVPGAAEPQPETETPQATPKPETPDGTSKATKSPEPAPAAPPAQPAPDKGDLF
jgi:recombinational DNA repair protein RecT